MTEWQWDDTLYKGAAQHILNGRQPYSEELPEILRETLALDSNSRLLDVGCGPGVLTLQINHLFHDVVGLDADADMLATASTRADRLGAKNVRWVCAKAESLPEDLGQFQVATFAQSFHWMDRQAVATGVLRVLEVGGAFAKIGFQEGGRPGTMPYPPMPVEAMKTLVRKFLGPERRAGRGVIVPVPQGVGVGAGQNASHFDVLKAAGASEPTSIRIPSPGPLIRSIDQVISFCLSSSASTPFLFADRLDAFVEEMRDTLLSYSPEGLFADPKADTLLVIWRRTH